MLPFLSPSEIGLELELKAVVWEDSESIGETDLE